MTGSMEPTIRAGELVVISEKLNYKVGDIVTYRDEDNFLVTHRIVEKIGNDVVTKGDNNNIVDNKITIENIVGKVVFHSKLLGFFLLYILKPLIIVYVIIFFIMNFYFSKKGRCENNEKENKINSNN